MIGVMFAPRQDRMTAALARVIKSGGQLFLANWTPASMKIATTRRGFCVHGRSVIILPSIPRTN
ncbi:MAG: hypothetical protein L0Z73_19605 [Gammaproteobacteria bacterium]|nr:hypothetical protein [Gammaproteobacteria bacterium]